MLFRAFKDIPDGFYIDVGAHDPIIGSVTKLFYDRGWSGINVEPGPRFAALCADRPRDLNLNYAVGAPGPIKLYEISSGLSTEHHEIASRHAAEGYEVSEREVESVALSTVFERVGDREIHFLKIDTEGAERQVILSGDFSVSRPWLLVVEATYPNTQIASHHDWEPLLETAHYRMVWFDGLNRWYVAEEHFDRLSSVFSSPLNVFDNYLTYREWVLQRGWSLLHELSDPNDLRPLRSIVNQLE